MLSKVSLIVSTLCVLSTFLCSPLLAQVSLTPGDQIDITVTVNGIPSTYTVIRDASQPQQWYYVPTEPKLAQIQTQSGIEPQLSLLKYQFNDPNNPNALLEGGILQFAVTLSAPAEAQKQMSDYLAQHFGGTPLLTALPMKSVNADIYAPTDGTLITKVYGSGVAPTFATQKAPFSLYLTKIGSDVESAVIGSSAQSNTGLGVVYEVTYEGLTPAASIDVTANYSKIFHHYSSDKHFSAQASYFGLFGASTDLHWTDIEQQLKTDGALKVSVVGNQEIAPATMDSVMQAVLKRINDQIFAALSPPPAIAPASAANISAAGRFASAGYSAAFKNESDISNVNDHFTWTERKIVERKMLVGGFVGVGSYPDSIRKKVVQFVPIGKWDNAYFLLPAVGNLPDLTQVQYKVDLISPTEATPLTSRTGIWRPGAGWGDENGKQISNLIFPLQGLTVGIDKSALTFHSALEIVQGSRTVTTQSDRSVFTNAIAVAPPQTELAQIELDPSLLSWLHIDPASKLVRIQATMTVGNQSASGIIRPTLSNSTWSPPGSLVWLIPKSDADSKPISLTLKFDYTDPSRDRQIQIMDLRKQEPSLSLLLTEPAQ